MFRMRTVRGSGTVFRLPGRRHNSTEASGTTVREIPVKFPAANPSSTTATECGFNSSWKSGREGGPTDPDYTTTSDTHSPEASPLYDTHIQTNYFQKAILSVGAAAAALLDPRRHDMVAVLGETTGHRALSRIYTQMIEDSEGQQILMEKPRINSSTIDLQALSDLPEDSLGWSYTKFLSDNKVTPDSRLPVQFVDDPELAYVMQRYREGHDLFHTLLGMPTNMLGEVAVKWVEALQTGLPMCYGGAVFGPLRFRPKQRQKYVSVYLPWAVRVGRSSRLMMNVYFEQRWEQSIHELRREFGIEPPPVL